MAETKNRKIIQLNECTVKIINGICYKAYSIYAGDSDFRQLYESLIAEKAARQQKRHCNGTDSAV